MVYLAPSIVYTSPEGILFLAAGVRGVGPCRQGKARSVGALEGTGQARGSHLAGQGSGVGLLATPHGKSRSLTALVAKTQISPPQPGRPPKPPLCRTRHPIKLSDDLLGCPRTGGHHPLL